MNCPTRAPSVFSRFSVKSQTVIPREVRDRLGLKPGDTLRYRVTEDGVLLDKAPANEADDRLPPPPNGPARPTKRRMAASDEQRYDPFDCRGRTLSLCRPACRKAPPCPRISNRKLAVHGLRAWVAMITSADNEPWSSDVAITDLRRAGLPAPSVVRPAKIACIEPARIGRRAGRLDKATARAVSQKLRGFLG